MTEEEQKRVEETKDAISNIICDHCPSRESCWTTEKIIFCNHNQTLDQILSLTDDKGEPLLMPLHPDQSLPNVPQLATLNPAVEAFCQSTQAIMIKQGWRRVILPAGKEG